MGLSAFRVTAQNGISFANVNQTVDSTGHAVIKSFAIVSAAKVTSRCAPPSLSSGRLNSRTRANSSATIPDGAKFIWQTKSTACASKPRSLNRVDRLRKP
ncbi:VirK family protein [Bradyrhizobium sp. CCGB12]|uniref:VirK family protein n=1 Tax=Bradyrhizobium sp. CCGB12 TaxID=2949632 RepID=UPI0020B31F6A|nr:VirK family protein [Bradyrhizobium sp. CCGB12]MCP3392156.1 VirK family protein [Bradyrhizobium sp. CCGB12]